MNQPANDLDLVRKEFDDFPNRFKTLLLATVSQSGRPNASYAAYVELDGDYYIYISELAAHTGNLQSTNSASVLFIENETDAGHLFGRRRITYDMVADTIPRDGVRFQMIVDQFSARFGSIMDNLRNLTDFHLFRLHPTQATYVAGFARAYTIGGEEMDQIRHINGRGHGHGQQDDPESTSQKPSNLDQTTPTDRPKPNAVAGTNNP